MAAILVYGWYNSGNIGDDLFAAAFKKLFPKYNFKFTSQLNEKILSDVDTVILGGGSFIDKDIAATPQTIAVLKTKTIMYIGVGAETNISPMHTELMKLAKLIAIRSPNFLAKIQELNKNVLVIPDLVYSLQDSVVQSQKIPKSILVIPNLEVVPNHGAAHWKHSSYEYFRSEFAQFLDELVAGGHQINFFSMCHNKTMSDSWAAAQIISMMTRRSTKYQIDYMNGDLAELTKVMSQFSVIITQRYHGIVLAEMMQTPYVSIHHHDKLKFASPMNGLTEPYFGIMKANLFNSLNSLNCSTTLPIETDIFDSLKQAVANIIS